MTVATPHPQYEAAMPVWRQLRDLAGGSRAVKSRGEVYLPRPSGMSVEDYRNTYLRRAALAPVLSRTVSALAGVVTAKPLSINVPKNVEGLLEDVTLAGKSLDDLVRDILQEVLLVGRCGLLADMPPAGVVADPRPYLIRYDAEDLTNWRTERRGGDPSVLTQVVIQETVDEPGADGFSHDAATVYRELTLDAEGFYRVRTWTRSNPEHVVDTNKEPWTASEWITRTRNGKPLGFIPFVFVGATGISPEVQRSPVEDLGDVLVAHYRNSADLEYGTYMTALPTPWVSGAADGNSPLKIGSSVAWNLSENGKAGMLEFSGQGLAAIREAMAQKERLAAVLGSRLLTESSTPTPATATEARLRFSGESATLRTIAGSVSTALTMAARWMGWWLSTDTALDSTIRVDLPTDFFTVKAAPDEVRAALMSFQAGALSYESFFNILASGGWVQPGRTVKAELVAIEGGLGMKPKDVDDVTAASA